ncbi:hypothetical protein H4S07_003119, partial [Coemansia furcata]
DVPPATPPRPTVQQTLAFVPPPQLPSYLPPAIGKLKAKLAAMGNGGGGEGPKGRVADLLYRESKQRSLSSSELDNIVPSDIAHQEEDRGVQAAAVVDDDVSSSRSFAVRRQRSRSQSAGVGISREMAIAAATQGQFPYLDANTCEFVGQLKSDPVKMGGAAASSSSSGGSRQRSNTAAGSARAQGGGLASSAPSSSTSSPVVKPASTAGHHGARGGGSGVPSGLRHVDNDGGVDLSASLGDFTFACEEEGSALAVPNGGGGDLRVDTTDKGRRSNNNRRGNSRRVMAPAVDDYDDEQVGWADFSTFAGFDKNMAGSSSSKRKSPPSLASAEDIDELTDMLQVLEEK